MGKARSARPPSYGFLISLPKKTLEFGDIALLCNDVDDHFQAWVEGSRAARLALVKFYKKVSEEEFSFNAFVPAKDLAALQGKTEETKA